MRNLCALFLLASLGFSLEWKELSSPSFIFRLDSDTSHFTLYNKGTNYLYRENSDYPPTSYPLILVDSTWEEASPTSFTLRWEKPWRQTNHILWSQCRSQSVLYTMGFFLTNQANGQPFIIAAMKLSNTSTEAVETGFRYLLDTTLQEELSSPLFWFENQSPVQREIEISINQYGDYILSGVVSPQPQGLFVQAAYNGFSPSVIYLANYHRLKNSTTTTRIESSSDFSYSSQNKRDGAILIEYRYRLRPNETIEGGIVLSLHPMTPLRWNASLFDFLVTTNVPTNQTIEKSPTNLFPSSPTTNKATSQTNTFYLTNTITISKGNEDYLALQRELINRLENLINQLTNTRKDTAPSPQKLASSPSQILWLPTEDPFATASPPSPKSKPQLTTPSPPQPQPSPSSPISPTNETPSTFPQAPSIVFVTNIITNFITIPNTSSDTTSNNNALVQAYEQQIHSLQKELLNLQSQHSTADSKNTQLQLIDKRLELLNWLIQRSSQVNLSAEELRQMNKEIDILLQSLTKEQKQ